MIDAVSGEFNTKERHHIICADYVHCYVSEIKELKTGCSGGSD
jgi:hypothetical protein